MSENNVPENAKRHMDPKRRTLEAPKPSVQVKRMWRKFKKENKSNLSLKQFTKTIPKDPVVLAWNQNRHGKLEKVAKALRLKNKGTIIAL